MNQKQTYDLILASKSPRRRELLEQMGISLKIIPSDLDENGIQLENPEHLVKELARLKAEDIAADHPESWTLGADTIVVVDDKVLGKPESKPDAARMLEMLSGRTHQVLTGFCLTCPALDKKMMTFVKTDVEFKPLSQPEIQWYINTGEPDDKAGAYGIQGKGAFLVQRICGSYSNVVGLPVCEVIDAMIALNIINLKGEN